MNEKFLNFKIGKKFTISFATVILCFCICIVITLIGMVSIGTKIKHFHSVAYKNHVTAMECSGNIEKIIKELLLMCTTGDPSEVEEMSGNIEKLVAEQNKDLEYLNANSEAQDLLNGINAKMIELRESRLNITKMVLENKNTEAIEAFKSDYLPVSEEITSLLSDLGDYQLNASNDDYNTISTIRIVIYVLSIICAGVAIALAVSIAKYLERMFTEPIYELEEAAKNLSQGRLDISIQYESEDELGSLAKNLNAMILLIRTIIPDIERVLGKMAMGDFNVRSNCYESYVGSFEPILLSMRNIGTTLSTTIKDIKEISEEVNSGAGNMAEGAQNLAEGATDQASSVEELTATIEYLADTSERNALNAEEAVADAKQISGKADRGKDSMENMVKSMENISKLSTQIEAIINTIDEIASQTNLLALNASIEAARAGQAGKGFAVVASEIGKLASESADAANNTRNLIQNTVFEVEDGNKMVRQTSDIIAEVLGSIDTIIDSITGLMESSQMQSTSLGEVRTAVEQISSVVQSTSATAEESSAISEELFAQSENLNNLVGQFILREE